MKNCDEKSYHNIIAQYEQLGRNSTLIAKELKQRKDELFIEDVEWYDTKVNS